MASTEAYSIDCLKRFRSQKSEYSLKKSFIKKCGSFKGIVLSVFVADIVVFPQWQEQPLLQEL